MGIDDEMPLPRVLLPRVTFLRKKPPRVAKDDAESCLPGCHSPHV